jgi:ABC-type branched-subunit amino acid transport system ATPase component
VSDRVPAGVPPAIPGTVPPPAAPTEAPSPAPEGVTVLEVEGIHGGYGGEDILRGVSIRVGLGEIVAVIGPNGSGKSTLLKAIFGLIRVSRGRITLRLRSGATHELVGRPPSELVRLGVGYVPQVANVFADMSIRENLEIGGFPIGKRAPARIGELVELFPVLAPRLRERAGTLSGGQRQMLAFARALMPEPELLVLDEPSAGLAPTIVDQVFDQVRAVNRTGVSILVVEQKARQCLAFSDYGYVLDMGTNRHQGPGRQLLHDQAVIDSYLGGRGRFARARRALAEGTPAAGATVGDADQPAASSEGTGTWPDDR